MALTTEERRAAAAARRQKVLGRGDSRMAQVTGTLAKPSDTPESAAEPAKTTSNEIHHAVPSTNGFSDISQSSNGGGGSDSGTERVGLNGLVASSSTPAAAPAASLKGTAAGGKWSEKYTDIKAAPSIIKRKRKVVLSLSEKLNLAVTATAGIRLFAAILQGLLLFSAWHLASASAPSSWTLAWQQRSFNKAWIQLQKSGYKGNLGPAWSAWKTITTNKLILKLKQPQWAALAATAQQHPMSILFTVNIAFILPTYLFLVLSKSSSSIAGGGGGASGASQNSSFFLWKIVSLVAPALQSQLSHALAVQRVLSSIIDCAVVVVVTLGVCQLVQLLLVVKNI